MERHLLGKPSEHLVHLHVIHSEELTIGELLKASNSVNVVNVCLLVHLKFMEVKKMQKKKKNTERCFAGFSTTQENCYYLKKK